MANISNDLLGRLLSVSELRDLTDWDDIVIEEFVDAITNITSLASNADTGTGLSLNNIQDIARLSTENSALRARNAELSRLNSLLSGEASTNHAKLSMISARLSIIDERTKNNNQLNYI